MTLDLDKLVKYCFLDPAGSKKTTLKKVRANSALVTIGVEQTTLQRIFVLEAWRGRDTSPQLMQRVIDTNERWHPVAFGIEANAMQSLFAELVGAEAQRLQQRLPLVPVQQPTKIEKEWRIRDALQPVVGHGRLFLLRSHVELIDEITGFPLAEFRDMIDALASAVAMVPRQAPAAMRNMEREALAKYHRQIGTAPRRIEEILADWDRKHNFAVA